MKKWGGCARRFAVIAVLMTANMMMGGMPALAHNGEHPVAIASQESVGPYLVSAWTSEGFSNGTIPLAVNVAGPRADEVMAVRIRLDSGTMVSLSPPSPTSPFAWTAVTDVSGGHQTAVIEVTDAGGSYQSGRLGFQVAVAGWGLALLLGIFVIQAIGYLVWLVSRTMRVWVRKPVTSVSN